MKGTAPYFKSYIHFFVYLFYFLSVPTESQAPSWGTGSVIFILYLKNPAGTQWTLNAHLTNNGKHGHHQLNRSSSCPSSCHHHAMDHSPVFSPFLTDNSAFSSVGDP